MATTVLGIDAGQVRLGLASVTFDGSLSVGQGAVLFHPKNNLKFNDYMNEGIYQICDSFPLLLHSIRPSFIVAEIVPVGRLGSNTELNVAAVTACKVIAWQWGIDWHDIAANSVKKIVTGDGKASKVEIRKAVINQFPSIGTQHEALKKEQKNDGIKPEGFPQDLFDAVAVALSGINNYCKEYGEWIEGNNSQTTTECSQEDSETTGSSEQHDL